MIVHKLEYDNIIIIITKGLQIILCPVIKTVRERNPRNPLRKMKIMLREMDISTGSMSRPTRLNQIKLNRCMRFPGFIGADD